MRRLTSPASEVLLRSREPRCLAIPLIFAVALVSGTCLAVVQSSTRVPGFSPSAAEREIELEKRYVSLASTERIRGFHRYLTSEPHPAGSKRNNELAQWVADQWRQQGLENITVHEYDVLNSRPREVSLEMVAPTHFRAKLREDTYTVDPDTRNANVDGAYLGYSASGEVTAPVVYAHSGNPEDYAYLAKNGIDIRGKIALVRYSNPYSYRGFKALTAQGLGAAAILIYSDPVEDGYNQGKVYPHGPWGPASHIQRGAITYDFLEPGDPLTPGYASVPGAKRIPAEDAISLPKIIGIPLSWRDAKPLLEHLGGPLAPPPWQGGLPLNYHLGGSRVRVHLKVDMDASVQPYYVTEARIRGAQFPDEWVVLGNHRDAWVFGAVDPSSGTAAMLELTHNLGELLRQGIRPKRTLIICSWDGEEYALTGSTEWGEQYAKELKQKAVAYLNVDEATSGRNFEGDAVGSLAPLLVDVSRELPAPSGKTLYEEWKISRRAELQKEGTVTDRELANTRIGSGSDHTVFLNFLGVPVMGLTFAGPYGVYHSVYDDFFWMNHFGDPGYRYHALMTELWGVLALRLANAEILPYDFAFYGATIRDFLNDLDNSTHLSGDVPLDSLRRQIAEFETSGRELNDSVERAIGTRDLDSSAALRVNSELIQVERNWCTPEGIPGRPWWKHSLYGARYTYAHLELPGLTEAAEARDWSRTAAQGKVLEDELAKNSALLHEIRRQLDAASGASE